MTNLDESPHQSVTDQARLENYLLARHGPLMGGEDLAHALGFESVQGFTKAVLRDPGLSSVVFQIPGRRGRFARTLEVVRWIESLGHAAPALQSPDTDTGST